MAWESAVGNTLLATLTGARPEDRVETICKGESVLKQFAVFTEYLAMRRNLGLSLGRRIVRALMRALHPPLAKLDERYVFSLISLEKKDPEAFGLLSMEIKEGAKAVNKLLPEWLLDGGTRMRDQVSCSGNHHSNASPRVAWPPPGRSIRPCSSTSLMLKPFSTSSK